MNTTTLAAWGGPIADEPEAPLSTMNFALSLAGPSAQDFAPSVPTQRCQEFVQGTGVIVQIVDDSGNPVNLRGATSLSIFLVKPSGTLVVVPASFFTNGLDGKIMFTTSLDIPANTGIDQPGVWIVQGKIVLDGDAQFTSLGYFDVAPNLGA